jgi:hypothetical protein
MLCVVTSLNPHNDTPWSWDFEHHFAGDVHNRGGAGAPKTTSKASRGGGLCLGFHVLVGGHWMDKKSQGMPSRRESLPKSLEVETSLISAETVSSQSCSLEKLGRSFYAR